MPDRDALLSLKRISDPTRARILRLLLDAPDGRGSVTRIAETLHLRQPTISHHLTVLREEGLVERSHSIADDQRDRVADVVPDDQPRDDASALDRIVDDLAARFRGVLARESIEQYVRDSYDLLDGRTNRASLTSAFAVSRLADLLRSAGERDGVPQVLFVCVQNAGRSQLAAAILRQLAGDRLLVRTAGSQPADAVRSTIVTVLDEVGTPLGGEFPKPLTDEAVHAADYVITMGCGDACPIYPGREYLDWDIPDPVGRPLAAVREIRDDIESRVRDLLKRFEAERLVNTADRA